MTEKTKKSITCLFNEFAYKVFAGVAANLALKIKDCGGKLEAEEK